MDMTKASRIIRSYVSEGCDSALRSLAWES